MTTSDLERATISLARQIAELGGRRQRSDVFQMSGLNERLMDWAMARPAFKTQLFRLVDVFPATSGADDVARHVREHLDGEDVPRLLRAATGVAGKLPFGSRIEARIARQSIERMARQFIVGATPDEAVPVLAELWRAGSAFTVDLLGEKTVLSTEADRYAARVVELMRALAAAAEWPTDERLERDDVGWLPRVNLSIKPSALSPHLTPLTAELGLEEASERLRPILRLARQHGAFVHFDMEHYDVKDLTLELFRRLLSEGELADLEAGIVVQAYLRDSRDDLAELIAWSARRSRPITVRLVKGAYWDAETVEARAAGWPVPVFEHKVETDANYERCIRLLHDHHGEVRAAFATHNLRSLAYAVAYARQRGIPDHGYEVQMLYGMAEPLHAAVRRLGLRLRVYGPVGELLPGMAYLVRRLLENTSNESFVRHRFAEGRELDSLLQPPYVPEVLGPASPVRRVATDPAGPGPYDPEPVAEWRHPEVRQQMHAAIDSLAAQLGWAAGATGAVDPAEAAGSAVAGAAIASEPDRTHVAEKGDETRAHDRRHGRRRLRRPGRSGDIGAEVLALVDGEQVRTEATIPSTDPATAGTVLTISASCGTAEVDAAVGAAVREAEGWRHTPPVERAAFLFRAAEWLRGRRPEIAAVEVFEAGKPWDQADADVCEAIDFCEYYGREVLRLDAAGAELVQSPPGESNHLLYQGKGVTAVIAPWNFPLAIPTGMTVAALVAGNPVVLKPAEQTPLVARYLVDALLAGGAPPGVVQFLPGLGEVVGAALVAHPDVAVIAFTGSRAVGLAINQQAAAPQPGQRHVKRVVAEMGGKNAIVVDADADPDQAVPGVAYSAFGFAGQKCSAASRVVVLDAVYDQFVDRLLGCTQELVVGHPRRPEVQVGPLIDEDAHKRVWGWVEQAAAGRSGRVRLQRDDVPPEGHFVGPTVVEVDDPDDPLVQEEIFGPVLAVQRARDLDEAIALANHTPYALTAGIFSRSPASIRRAAAELRAGNVYVNRAITGAVVGRQPFGGYGMSGVGSKAGGPDYLLQFLDPRVVTENTLRQGFVPEE